MGQETSALLLREITVNGYERVVEVKEEEVGLHAIIALHDTRLGPALGGVRAYPYRNFDEALTDVLRLSKGMTYKAAVARTGTGGGKSVILTKAGTPKTEEVLLAFAEAVNQFNGHYICAEDVGMGVDDLAVVRQGTHYVVGLPHPKSSGDPSYFTAWGGYKGIQAVCQSLWGSPSVKGKTIAIQGLGAVGMKLAATLFWEGAHLVVADVDSARCAQAAKSFAAKVVSPKEILSTPCDILAPCALGGILNPMTIPQLCCKAVAGVANNQLLKEEDGRALMKRQILYAPDYVVNSGGLMNVCVELETKGYNPARPRDQIDHVYDCLLAIFETAKTTGKSTHQVADEIAEDNLTRGIGKRTQEVMFHH